ncbi:MAG: fatty acid desaturase, partial [Ilumatobacteraceae bacterium]|nr:fatty acid desaturase [Ilumatobacteraceae bacterium]
MMARNYSLAGPDTAAAHAAGLVDADWFLPTVDPVRLRDLQRRGNARAGVDTALWVGLLLGSAWLAWWSIGTDGVIWWQAVPAFALYGALYGGAADARWHECGHGTAFASRRANDVVYAVASFMLWRGPTLWRWSHHRHHTDTIIVGRDAEIAFQRPPSLIRTAIALTNLRGGVDMLWRQMRHAAGRLDTDALDLVPASDHRRVITEARVFVGIVGGVVVWCVLAGSIVPALFIGGPTIYGGWL